MSAQQEIVIGHVVQTPDTCGGAPRITGTRIRVSHIVLMTEQGLSADEIIRSLPHLTLGQVHGALSYYHDHVKQIDDEIRETDEAFRRLSGRS